ncbi:hypothetical protein BDF19DRAFT_454790 [Syncephalis fuscata]|nr:hypothetical protein BDF19DRAFT_454790 [Syncephalis fuscata]
MLLGWISIPKTVHSFAQHCALFVLILSYLHHAKAATESAPPLGVSSEQASPSRNSTVISVKDGENNQNNISPTYVIVGVTLVIVFIIMFCIGVNFWTRRKNRPEYQAVVSNWTSTEQASYAAARSLLKEHPPECIHRPLTEEEKETITEQGVAAWKVRAEDTMPLGIYVHQGTEISFNWQLTPQTPEEVELPAVKTTTPLLLQTNLPIPRNREIFYFEVKLAEKPADTEVGIGLATHPYPNWRMPGFHEISVGYLANTGQLHVNNSFEGRDYGGTFFEGDVIGVCVNTHSGGVLFTRNGVQQEAASTGMTFDLYPVVAANGPCNIHHWGFAPVLESTAQAPPAYGSERGSVLLEMAPSQRSNYPPSSSNQQQSSTARTGRYLSSSTTPEITSPLREAPLTSNYGNTLTVSPIATAPSSTTVTTASTAGAPPPPYVSGELFTTALPTIEQDL